MRLKIRYRRQCDMYNLSTLQNRTSPSLIDSIVYTCEPDRINIERALEMHSISSTHRTQLRLMMG